MSVPWRDKAGVTHAWDALRSRNKWGGDPRHAGWYTARAPCGAARKLRHGRDHEDRVRGAGVDCVACLAIGDPNA